MHLEANAKMKKNVSKTNGIVFISSYLPSRFRPAKPARSCESGLPSLHHTPNSEELTSDCGEPQAGASALLFPIIHPIYFRPPARPLFAEFDAHNCRAIGAAKPSGKGACSES